MGTTMPLHPDELRRMLRAARKPREKALLVLLWRAGMRSFEATALEASDTQQLDRGGLAIHIRNGKGGKARYVRIDKRSADFLRPMIELHPTGTLLQTRTGSELQTSWVRRTVARIALQAGIRRRVHPHCLRHSFARDLHDEDFSVREIQVALGHSNLNTTEIYLRGIGCDQVGERLEGREW